ncbi:Replication factor A protein 3 [Golovinomyces cichoracearum]|uniref:Replication factor A protein 3 n=1 Tax=Golovinomyces cichoracearum TaxID=62708 RepID=A0A420HCJ7_9PEZI|nr:Replication factor A protein 3 [Golovinomyces cichoracearum]
MAELISTPRITSSHLDSFTNRTIRLLGKVTQLRGETAIVDSDGNVTLHLNREAHLTVGHVVEVVGKVNQDLSVRVLKSTDVGKDVDLDIARSVVDATHRYKNIFYKE